MSMSYSINSFEVNFMPFSVNLSQASPESMPYSINKQQKINTFIAPPTTLENIYQYCFRIINREPALFCTNQQGANLQMGD